VPALLLQLPQQQINKFIKKLNAINAKNITEYRQIKKNHERAKPKVSAGSAVTNNNHEEDGGEDELNHDF